MSAGEQKHVDQSNQHLLTINSRQRGCHLSSRRIDCEATCAILRWGSRVWPRSPRWLYWYWPLIGQFWSRDLIISFHWSILQPTNMGMHWHQSDEDWHQLQPPGVQRLAGLDLHHLQAQETEEEASSEVGASSQQGEGDQRLWETTRYSEVRLQCIAWIN